MTASIDEIAKTLLAAETDITAITSTRIFMREELGPKGIMHDDAYGIYDVHEVMRPTIILNLRPNVGWGGINDLALKVNSSKQVVEVYIYDDAKHRYTTIRALGALVNEALNGARTSLGELGWINTLEKGRDYALEEAYFERWDFEIARINKPT